MDKNAIKKYAVWARRELISRVSQKAMQYGITDTAVVSASAPSVNGVVLSAEEMTQRKALIAHIETKGYEQVMEEVAYTWFNRFIALRFMEVNGYLPSHVRVFTDEDNAFKPQIITEAINLELDGLDMDKVYALKDANDNDALFKYLIITQCNALSPILPRMFQRIADYTELLFPDNLLREGSAIQQMIELIPEDDWKDAVQIIGWLYQYYIAEPKDTLINARKKYSAPDVPFVTQLFTPDWIVRFLVENSLGQFFRPAASWVFQVKDGKESQNIDLRDPSTIFVIDPCCGSGHILTYTFDVLMHAYEAYGYTTREAVEQIITKNIYGLDIDERAAQLAYFSVMMKARQYDRRFFARHLQPNIYTILQSDSIDSNCIEYFCNNSTTLKCEISELITEMKDASIYGSLTTAKPRDWESINKRFQEIEDDYHILRDLTIETLLPIVKVAEILSRKYDVVVTNPPYMNSSYMPSKLKNYVQKYFPDFKNDLFAAFSKATITMCKKNGYIGLLMPYVWMFISSYEKMRSFIYKNADITTLVQLEYNAFEAACVPVAAMVLKKDATHQKGTYIKLSDFKGIDVQEPKTLEAINDPNCQYRFSASLDDMVKIPGAPFAYWITDTALKSFEFPSVESNGNFSYGVFTCDNARFLRLWHEVSAAKSPLNSNSTQSKWRFLNKGGSGRKWYGNLEYVINYGNGGEEIKKFRKESGQSESLPGEDYYFLPHISWSLITSASLTFRYYPAGMIFDISAPAMFAGKRSDLLSTLAVLNSKIGNYYLPLFNPTMNNTNSDIKRIPFIVDPEHRADLLARVEDCIRLSKEEWDSYETSWDFKSHPLVTGRYHTIREAFDEWTTISQRNFDTVLKNEQDINQLLIRSYRLGDEISPEVDINTITLRTADVRTDIKSLISYAVGCMFGRYSLDVPGLAFAGGDWDDSKYITFKADKDSIIPICDDEYFADDIVGRFIRFVEVVYGKDALQENLQFIAEALDGTGQPKDVIRNYFLNDFYTDHLKVYQKRPIYWLFDSGKKDGFKALVYMHRYAPDTIARMRTDYVHEQQARYRTAITDVEQRMASASTSERVKLSKKLKTLQEQAAEIQSYEEKIHHLADQYISIDLDDGVKKNYEIFKDVLAKIK